MKPGIYPGIPETEYHADPAFSQSAAKVLLRSPARYRHELDNPPPPRDVFDLGTAAHAKILGVGAPITVIDADSWRTKAAQEARDAARAAGTTPLLLEDARRVDAMAEAVLANPPAREALEAAGDTELSLWWTDPDTGIACRGRIDKASQTIDGVSLVDLKTTTDASPWGFAGSAAKYGYRLQGGAYCDGWEHASGGDVPASFLIVAVEKDPPYLVGTYSVDPFDLDAGRAKWREACALLAECRANDTWPPFATHTEPFAPLNLPAWSL